MTTGTNAWLKTALYLSTSIYSLLYSHTGCDLHSVSTSTTRLMWLTIYSTLLSISYLCSFLSFRLPTTMTLLTSIYSCLFLALEQATPSCGISTWTGDYFDLGLLNISVSGRRLYMLEKHITLLLSLISFYDLHGSCRSIQPSCSASIGEFISRFSWWIC